RLARPLQDFAVLVHRQRTAAQEARRLALETFKLWAFEQNVLAPDVLKNYLLRQAARLAGQLLRRRQIGDREVNVPRAEPRPVVVVEKAVRVRSRAREHVDVVEHIQIEALEHLPPL